MKTNNLQKLGNVLSQRMVGTANAAVPLTLELATVNADLSITTDSLPQPIAQNEYLIDIRLTHENYYSYNELNSSRNAPHHHEGGEHAQVGGPGTHTHDDGLHDHRVPSVFRKLQPGDRVLVAWVGSEPVVVSILVSGETVTQN